MIIAYHFTVVYLRFQFTQRTFKVNVCLYVIYFEMASFVSTQITKFK